MYCNACYKHFNIQLKSLKHALKYYFLNGNISIIIFNVLRVTCCAYTVSNCYQKFNKKKESKKQILQEEFYFMLSNCHTDTHTHATLSYSYLTLSNYVFNASYASFASYQNLAPLVQINHTTLKKKTNKVRGRQKRFFCRKNVGLVGEAGRGRGRGKNQINNSFTLWSCFIYISLLLLIHYSFNISPLLSITAFSVLVFLNPLSTHHPMP